MCTGGCQETTDTDSWPVYNEEGGSCFIAGTRVTMSDGTTKDIEAVAIGDMLLGENGISNKVLDFERPKLGNRELYSINGGPYFITPAHPLRTTDGWKSISISEIHRENTDLVDELDITELKIGDELMRADGSVEVVNSIRGKDDVDDTQLYNFILNGDHTYYVDGYLTHNEF